MYDNIARYVKACDNEGVLVTKQEVLLPKDVRVVDLSRRHISDVAISTLVEPIATRSQDVSVMDLSHNTIVDGVMKILGHIIPPAVRHVSDEPMWRLDTLNLSHNPLSTESIKELGQVIRLNCLHVRRLDLSGVPMAMKAFSAISWAVSRGQQITEIGLANTQCGRHCQDACQVVVRLCTVVEKIDLSCNYFKEEGLAALGSVLASKDAMVKVLSLAENVWAATCDSVNRLAHGGDSRMLPGADTAFEKSCVRDANALNILAEAIGDNNSLEDLSLAGSQLDQRTAICLEDSILQHPTLQHIDVSRNPLGLAGLRAILRLVADERSPLRGVTARELRGSSPDPLVAYNPVCMNFDYTGSRSLNMGLPYHRAIVRLLVRRGDALQIRLSFLLKDFAVNGTPAAFIFERCSDGLRRKVPKSGVVTFHFTLVDAAGGHSTASEEVLDWHRRRKTKVAMERFLLLMKLWRQEVTQEDRPLFLEAMFQDLRYNNGQAMCFLHEVAKTDPPLLPSVLSHMFGGIDDISLGVVISVLRNVRWTGGYYLKLPARVVEDSVKQASNLVFLNPDSPTGRYAFNLRYPADHVALDRFFIVAHWDAATAAKRTLPDFTEAGDHYGIRNFTVNDVWVEYKPSWMPPDCWDLRVAFDFVSSLKPCVVTARQRSRTRKVNSMPACTFVQFVSLLRAEGTDAAEESRFRALRGHADKVLVDASQLRSVLEAVGPAWRVEFFVLLFPRCLSRGAPLNDNFKGILADRNFFDEDSVSQISERLGPANVFDIMTIHCRPKNVFCFDFSRRDQALLFRRLVMQIALAETANGIKNNVSLEVIQKIRFHEDGCERCFWRIPDEWYSSLPPSGRVVFVYSLSDPRMVLTDVRAHFARTVLGWMDVYASR